MNGVEIITAAAVIGIIGLLVGLLLGVAAKAFAVEVDEKEILVREQLPGNNCGGCGYAGCDALAKAIAQGEASVDACPVGGDPVGKAIAKIMGVTAGDKEREVAFVKCAGTCDKAETKYNYYGIYDCKKLALIPGNGDKACSYGCMGYGSCVRACPFDAIHVINGIAKVDKEKCKACGKCIAECPKHLIELVPYKAKHVVQCSSQDKGKAVKDVCSTGCIGCGLCVKQCEFDAISVENNIAHIDQSKCTGCGKCAEKCPSHVIV
ncbi:RnfABCDGE type electron transport complex subunit B [[Clostridium] polysaccharolyticum]|uniref:Ion-translocating oxidoreductase complex subunit B n=1 Tax=[Clostridium] polysaccharolyticum TaxID=29364 RepID=A0A1I0BTX9_9FIRM|nr:RnfABCDGE type electron transport complex subunit B [[Clostridium] polysaccharolyticum]SET10408.1 electron transport complex, RnfABCDGE type, B subunit [[Clostridium] polysaccharolyticum]